MVSKTNKHRKNVGRNKTIKKKYKKNLEKKCVTDDEMGKICTTGQYSTYEGNFYNNKKNIEIFKKIGKKFSDDKKYKKFKTHKQRYNQFLKENFEEKNIPKVIHQIKNDYYSFANTEWFKENDIEKKEKKYYVQIDDFRIIQEEVYYKLISYVKDFVKANPHSKKAKAINNVYRSLVDNTTKSMYKHVDAILVELDTFVKNNDMYGLLAMVNSNETIAWCSPIHWFIAPDEKNVKQYKSHLETGQLGIYDSLIYNIETYDDNETKKYKALVKTNYLNYIDEVFKACMGTKNAIKHKAEDIWKVESEMIAAMTCDEKIKSDPNFYNKIDTRELTEKYDFDWKLFSKKLGYTETPKNVIVAELNTFKCIVKLFKERWNSPEWQSYWIFIQFKQMVRFEDSLRHIHYNFHDKFLKGQPAQMPSEIYPIFGLSLLFNTFLSEQYIEHNYNPLYVNYVKHLVDDLKELFIKKIEVNDWLSPSTKKSALHKLKKLSITVGKPEHLRYDPIFNYKADDPLVNVGLLLNWKHKKYIALEDKPVIDIPEFDWNAFKITGTQCYVVNAYYMPDKNSIYVPLGYLQKPFIDLQERGLDYNLIYVGYTLGHELSHALDDMGSEYDADGNLNNWWTDKDRVEFRKKMDDVVKQYETFAKRDGIKFDAEISIGEDLADISGMALVESYLLDNQVVNGESTNLKKMNLAKFYMNFALQGHQKIYKQAVKAQLKMNPHPLEKYRCNCPLARSELFKSIYGIKKGDGMYWTSDTIW